MHGGAVMPLLALGYVPWWGVGAWGGGVMPLLALGYVVQPGQSSRAGDTSTAAEAGGYALSSDRGEDFFFFLDFWAFFILIRFYFDFLSYTIIHT